MKSQSEVAICDDNCLRYKVRRSGDFLFFSGLLGYEEPCKTAVKDSTKQVEMAFHWMDKTLKSAGIGWIDLVSVTSYHA